jgi:hypothetical protein
VQQQPQVAHNGACAIGSEEQYSVVVDHLDFSYPGLGGCESVQPHKHTTTQSYCLYHLVPTIMFTS